MHQIETGNYGWLQAGLPVESQDNGKEATRCCYSNHYNTDEPTPHQEILGRTSAVNKPKLGRERQYIIYLCIGGMGAKLTHHRHYPRL